MAEHKPHKNHFVKREAIDFGFNVAKKNIFFFITLFATMILVNVVLGVLQAGATGRENSFAFILLQIVRFLVGVVISMGVINISLMFVKKQKPQIKDLFYTKNFLNYLLVTIVRSIIVFVGFILFIIPGIIFSIKLQFANYLVVDKNMGVADALNKSWEITKGIKWNLFLFWLLLFLINVMGLLAILLGLLITIPLSMVATAYVYKKLHK